MVKVGVTARTIHSNLLLQMGILLKVLDIGHPHLTTEGEEV